MCLGPRSYLIKQSIKIEYWSVSSCTVLKIALHGLKIAFGTVEMLFLASLYRVSSVLFFYFSQNRHRLTMSTPLKMLIQERIRTKQQQRGCAKPNIPPQYNAKFSIPKASLNVVPDVSPTEGRWASDANGSMRKRKSEDGNNTATSSYNYGAYQRRSSCEFSSASRDSPILYPTPSSNNNVHSMSYPKSASSSGAYFLPEQTPEGIEYGHQSNNAFGTFSVMGGPSKKWKTESSNQEAPYEWSSPVTPTSTSA